MSHCEPSPGPSLPAAAVTGGLDQGFLVALVGRPNSGKSSLFNHLTGGHAHVGNFPGVTVDILEATVALPHEGAPLTATFADLPGLYSLAATVDPATDEGVARRFLEGALSSGRPVVVVQVVDGTQLPLGLRLTREVLRIDAPVVIAVTQHDLLAKDGKDLDEAALSQALGVPALAVSAREASSRQRLFELVTRTLKGDAGASRLARRHLDFAPDDVAARVLTKRDAAAPEKANVTAALDAVLLHPFVGPVAFLLLMATLFASVFLVADPVTTVLDGLRVSLATALRPALGGGLFASFVTDGLLGGAGTVLAFMPQIVILTVAMELLDASGYLARGAFLMDRVLRLMGMSGRAFVPLLMGHACAVPAIGATRVIRDPRERLTTILVLPLMTCSARLPTYGLVIATFFAASSAWTKSLLFMTLYFSGIAMGLVASWTLRRTATKGRKLPLVLELPAYRAPQGRVVLRQVLRSAKRFLVEVGTTILAVAAVLWVLLTVPAPRFLASALDANVTTTASASAAPPVAGEGTLNESLAGTLGRALEPVTRPLGFDWRINVGLIGSLGARELMVGTLGIIFGIEGAEDDPSPLAQRLREAKKPDGSKAYGQRTGLALLAFFVIACQCMSTVAAIQRETRSWRWPALVLAYTYGVAYAAALLVYNLSGLLGVP